MSKVEQILATKQFNPSLVKIGNIKGNYLSIFYPINDQDGEFTKLKIQTPKMKIPFEIQERKTKTGKLFAINVTVSTDEIGTEKNKSRIEMFREKILDLEKKIQRILPPEFQNKTFSSCLWQGKNLDFKPTMRLSIKCYDELPLIEIFDSDGDISDISELVPKSIGTFIIALDSVWSTDDKVGINWNIEQVSISKEKSSKKSKNFVVRNDLEEEY